MFCELHSRSPARYLQGSHYLMFRHRCSWKLFFEAVIFPFSLAVAVEIFRDLYFDLLCNKGDLVSIIHE